ncbi:MAG: hypothetical protein KDD25_03935 [Bdellovibrionales bacterium]|nr:hypothetical protein [Bdellovibrionales bacterium]
MKALIALLCLFTVPSFADVTCSGEKDGVKYTAYFGDVYSKNFGLIVFNDQDGMIANVSEYDQLHISSFYTHFGRHTRVQVLESNPYSPILTIAPEYFVSTLSLGETAQIAVSCKPVPNP